ncbi:hypothetical protein FRB94_004967 [Tulasnella sp. JGI-2019a]|nr:hypothetical protein FRB94_004967 [Tulasnella sp. JGI-2019a]
MEEEIEIATQRLTDCLMAATREAVLVRNWSHHSKPWWTKEVKESLKRVKELDEESKDCYQRFRQVDFDLENRLAEAKKEFKCKCKKAKRDDTNKKLEEAGKGNVYDFKMWTQGKREYLSPPIAGEEG